MLILCFLDSIVKKEKTELLRTGEFLTRFAEF